MKLAFSGSKKNNYAAIKSKVRPKLLDDFLLGKDLIISTIHKYLSVVEGSLVCININPNQLEPIIFPLEKKTKDCITIEEFFNFLVKRWEAEAEYLDEINVLKDQIYECVNKITDGAPDISFTEFLNEQVHTIINNVFDLTEIDQKQAAGEFCSGLINGFESDLQKNIDKIVKYIFFQRFLTPFPRGLLELIKSKFNKLPQKEKKKINAEKIIKEIIIYVQNYLQPIKLATNKYYLMLTLINCLKKLSRERKQCCVMLENHDELRILLEIKNLNCIKYFELKCDFSVFKQKKLDPNIDYLEITDYVDSIKFDLITTNISSNIKILSLSFREISVQKVSRLISSLIFLRELHLDFSAGKYITPPVGLDELFSNLKRVQFIVCLHINLSYGDFKIEDNNFSNLAQTILELKNLTKLYLEFGNGNNCIKDKGIKDLATSLESKLEMTHFSLEIKFNSLEFIDNLSQQLQLPGRKLCIQLWATSACGFIPKYEWSGAFKSRFQYKKWMLNLNTQIFCLNKKSCGNHFISDDGFIALGNSLSGKFLLSNLALNFSWGNNHITNQGLISFSNSIKNLKTLNFFDLCLNGNKVDNNSIEELAKTIWEWKDLTRLSLYFRKAGFVLNRKTLANAGCEKIAQMLKTHHSKVKIIFLWQNINASKQK